MKKIFFLIFSFTLLCICTQIQAQPNKKIQKLLNKKDYPGAIKEYEKEYNEKGNKTAAVRIGDLYYRLEDYKQSYYWYNKESGQLKKYNQSILKYADVCKYMGEYQKALDNYILYAIEANAPDAVMEKTQQCEALLKAESQSYLYQEELLPFNTTSDEKNISLLRNNPIMSSNKNSKNTNQFDFYMFQREHEKWLEPIKVQKDLPADISRTAISFTADGNKVCYATQDLSMKPSKNNIAITKIFFATNMGNQWLNTIAFPYNSDKYACNYPCISGDGSFLIFASDMPGGYGGYDLYITKWEGNTWKEPVNLGSLINTKDDEIAPYLASELDGEWLYYSSNHGGGFGGYDIYKSQMVDNTFLMGELLPPPINSKADDISFAFEPGMRGGFFTSNRSGGKGGFDAYHFKSYNLKIQVIVLDASTRNPLDYCEVKLLNNSVKINEGLTNGFGNTEFQVGKNKQYTIIVNKEGYIQNNTKVQTNNSYNTDSVQSVVLLSKDPSYKTLSPSDPLLSNAINFRGKVLNYDGLPVPANVRMVNFQTGKMKIFNAEPNGNFEVNLLSNSNYKIIIEYKDQHIEDEITTYGISPGAAKSRTYNLDYSKSKVAENFVDSDDLTASTKNTSKTNKTNKSQETAIKEQPKENTKPITTKTESVSTPATNSTPNITATTLPKTSIENTTTKETLIEPIALNNQIKSSETKSQNPTLVSQEKPSQNTPVVNEKNQPAITVPKGEVKQEQPKTETSAAVTPTLTSGNKVLTSEERITPKESEPVAMNTTQPISSTVVKNNTSNDKLTYKIQLGAYTDKNTDFSFLYGLGDIEIKPSLSGQYIFSLGAFNSVDDARINLDKVRNKGLFTAFIVCYYNDEKVSIIR